MNNLIKEISKLCSLTYNSPNLNKELFTSRPYYIKNNECVFYQCNEEPHFYSTKKDCQAYVCKFDDILCISFRGTESIDDILTDLNISRVPIDFDFPIDLKEDIYVHRGFLNQFDSIKLNIDQEIIEYYIKDSNKKKIIFSGHSLGGALATIASLYFKLKYNSKNIFSYIIASWANFRTRLFRLPFGDQCILINRQFYNSLGGYSCLPIMEDIEFILRVSKNKRKLLDSYVTTSFQKYLKNGILKQSLNNLFRQIKFLINAK